MKAILIAVAGFATLAATPALADRYDGHRGGYGRDHHRGDGYRDGNRGYRDGYRGHRGGYYRDGYRGYRGDYGRRYYSGYRGYNRPYYRPYRRGVVVVPAYGYGYGYGDPYYGGGGYYRYPAAYARPYRGYRGYRGGYRCSTGSGAVLGAIAGGLIGNAAGGRYDRGVPTIAGAGIGAIAGDAIERSDRC